jgi:alkanesulfonate monooxygenase SsuD/methylene tetrahydromethanopterin reductase-like flavin-dependent oxidoreductase (luciferase family)
MTVQFGIFDHIEGIAGTSHRQLLKDRIELIQRADEAGFTGYHLAEHHGSDLCLAPNQELFLAAAAQATENIRLGPMVKLLPMHHPVQVVEDICVLDQLSGGRVDYGVGRGAAACEHFWYSGDWFNATERFDEALGLIFLGLQTGKMGSVGGKHYDFPEIPLSMSPFQHRIPFWYPGNAVVAGRFGLNLLWPGAIPEEVYDLYVSTWNEYADSGIRANAPGARPRVGSIELLALHEDADTALEIAYRGLKGTVRRVVHLHTYDHQALNEEEAEAALNPIARGAAQMMAPGGDDLIAARVQNSGTPGQVRERMLATLADGRTDYIVLQFPAGDMTLAESRHTLELFVNEVKPALEAATS